MHYIRKSKSLIYSTRKAFLEKPEVELVYKFDEKSYHECLKKVGRSLPYDSNFFVQKCIYIYIYKCMYTNTNHFTPLELCVQGNNASIGNYLYSGLFLSRNLLSVTTYKSFFSVIVI